MDYVVLIVVLATSLMALPVTFMMNKMKLKDIRIVFVVFALCLAVVATISATVLKRRYRSVDFIIWVFATLCFSNVVNLIAGLEMDGFVKGFVGKVISEQEPYLNSSHGSMVLYWDGGVHFLLELAGVVLFTMQESYREVGLYWAGSFVNTMLVLLGGAILGKGDVNVSTLLNASFLVLPLIAAFKFIRERPLQARSYRRVASIVRRPVDLFFLLCFAFALGLAVIRGLIALGAEIPCLRDYVIIYEPYLSDPSAFPKVQMLLYLFYYGFYYLCVIDSLLNPGQLWMADWSLIHAGAAAQSQFTYMAGALHPKTGRNFRAPKTGVAAAVFWGFNLLLLVVPHLFAWRCWRDPDTCGRTYTQDVARPVSQPPTRQSYRPASKRE